MTCLNIQGLYVRSENLTFTNKSQVYETLAKVALVLPASGGTVRADESES